MIRDFCGISKNRLIDEINELRTRTQAGTAPAGVQIDTIEAIDAVRAVGNIGAHMEKDINSIVAVDPAEAYKLIQLLEMLFLEWYIARHQRKARLKAIIGLKQQKKDEKEASTMKQRG